MKMQQIISTYSVFQISEGRVATLVRLGRFLQARLSFISKSNRDNALKSVAFYCVTLC